MNLFQKFAVLAGASTVVAATGLAPARADELTDSIAKAAADRLPDVSVKAFCARLNNTDIPKLNAVGIYSVTAKVEDHASPYLGSDFGPGAEIGCVISVNGRPVYTYDKVDIDLIKNGEPNTPSHMAGAMIGAYLSQADAWKAQNLLTPPPPLP